MLQKLYLMRGKISMIIGDYSSAFKDFDTAVNLDPNNGLAFFYRGRCHQLNLEREEAIADYQNAIELIPDEPIFYYYRANLLEQQGKDANADYDIYLKLS